MHLPLCDAAGGPSEAVPNSLVSTVAAVSSSQLLLVLEALQNYSGIPCVAGCILIKIVKLFCRETIMLLLCVT